MSYSRNSTRQLITTRQSLTILTEREDEVLNCIWDGLSNKEIASKLGVAPKTIEKHRANLLKKFDVHYSIPLVRKALQEGFLKL